MIVVLAEAAGLGLRRVRWRDRVVVRVRTSALDRRLAAGASPESSVPLALHAARLCEPTERQVLARSLTRIVAAADAPMVRRLAAPVHRPAVRRCPAPSWRRLPVASSRRGLSTCEGVARIRTLLADGTGPLYRFGPLVRQCSATS